ncbi:MAG: YkgJ family cysteine cluster protein [Deltaproteobacteria bacterium]|nr:YkgJ family cysteine cluster protein [Deltaproteobacteria bacterium]
MKQADSTDDELAEYRALVDKVDAAVAAAAARAGEQVTCRAGCSSCCVDGLSVMPVEAHAIAAHVAAHGLDAVRASEDACVFLDGRGRCRVYAARPLLCRTHGLPLRTREPDGRGALPIVDDLSVCGLNFTGRPPVPAEALNADLLLQLLVTIDRRFRARQRRTDAATRVSLRGLADALIADDG